MTDKDDDFFEPAKLDLSKCVEHIEEQTTDASRKPLLGTDSKPMLQQVMVVTNAEAYDAAKELQKNKTRIKEEE